MVRNEVLQWYLRALQLLQRHQGERIKDRLHFPKPERRPGGEGGEHVRRERLAGHPGFTLFVET